MSEPEKGPLFGGKQARTLSNSISPTCDWKQVGDDLDGEGRGYQMGKAVAFSRDGSTVAVGAPGGLFSSVSTSGRVRLFRVSENGLVALGKPIEGEFIGDEAGGALGTYY